LLIELEYVLELKEALKDYAANEHDIKMFKLMIEGKWHSINNPENYLKECLDMRGQIAEVIMELGGEVPTSETEETLRARAEKTETELASLKAQLNPRNNNN
jgi:hypothetical protein